MTKLMVGVAAGVFLGAFALELLKRKRPDLASQVRERARSTASDLRDAFADGYQHAR